MDISNAVAFAVSFILSITGAANTDTTAVRTDPPPAVVEVAPIDEPGPEPVGLHGLPFAPAGLSDCAEMQFYRIEFGLPARFDKLGWRESNCRNEEGVHTWCCWGYWQEYVSLHRRSSVLEPRYSACGVYSRYDLDSDTPLDKQRQACVTKAVFDVSGYSPWAT